MSESVNEWMNDTWGICVGLYTTAQLISGCLSGTEMKLEVQKKKLSEGDLKMVITNEYLEQL